MKITSVETQLASLPLLGGAWGDSIHRVTHIEIVVTDVTTDTGLVGTGFSHTSGVGGTTIKALLERDIGASIESKCTSLVGLASTVGTVAS